MSDNGSTDPFDVAAVQAQLRDTARHFSGLDEDDNERRSFRSVAKEHKVSMYPLIALVSLGVSQSIGLAGAFTLQPSVARSLGFDASFAVISGLVAQVVGFAVPLLVSVWVKDRPIRATLAVVSGAAWALTVVWAGFIPTALLWGVYITVDTVTSSIHNTVNGSLSMDLYPPRVRVRAFAALMASEYAADLMIPVMVIVLVGQFHLTWRGVYLVTGLVSLAIVAIASRLKDPGYGKHDRQKLREAVRDKVLTPEQQEEVEIPKPHHPTLIEVYRTMWSMRTIRLSLIGSAVSGLSYPVYVALGFFLADQVNFGPSQLALTELIASAAALTGLYVLAPIGDRIFRRSPRTLYRISAGFSVVASLSILVNVWLASPAAAYILAGVMSFAGSFIGPASAVGGMSLIAPEQRHYVGSVYQIAVLTGTLAGGALFVGARQSVGFVQSLVALVILSIIGAILTSLAGDEFVGDIDAGNDQAIEDELALIRGAVGDKPRLLECRQINASYGNVQALFDIDITVSDGEMVALLGLNGSGKSTVLRTIAGQMMADSGTVRFQGSNITFASVEQRVGRGIVMMRGGMACFPSLTVADNLRTACPREAPDQIAVMLERFPELQPLQDRPARYLSGGEAQMLGLARAFLLQPRLLLIDELSLGLAPHAVARLMADVRELNAAGTTIIIVEQSINVAVELADRAMFLDRGVLRFDGPIDELRQRDDLLRAVFLREALA